MIGFLLDTSFLSALGNPDRPGNRPAFRWYDATDERELFTCTIVIGEIARGITRLRPGRRREHYRHWLRHEVLPAFSERVLSFDVQAALQWGKFMGMESEPAPYLRTTMPKLLQSLPSAA